MSVNKIAVSPQKLNSIDIYENFSSFLSSSGKYFRLQKYMSQNRSQNVVLFFFGNVVTRSTKLRLQNILEFNNKKKMSNDTWTNSIRARRGLVVTRWICKFKYRQKQAFFETIWQFFTNIWQRWRKIKQIP